MWLAPNGPSTATKSACTRPPESEVVMTMASRLQSPGPVVAPLAAHSVTTRASPGENPDAVTVTCCPEVRSVAGVTVTCWAPTGGAVVDASDVVEPVGPGAVDAGPLAGEAVPLGNGRTTVEAPPPQPTSSPTSRTAAQ